MADRKISQLSEKQSVVNDDELIIVDSEVLAGSEFASKKVKKESLLTLGVRDITADYTIGALDNRYILRVNSATDVNITLDTASLELGNVVILEQVGAGVINLVEGTGVSIFSNSITSTDGIGSGFDLFKVSASDYIAKGFNIASGGVSIASGNGVTYDGSTVNLGDLTGDVVVDAIGSNYTMSNIGEHIIRNGLLSGAYSYTYRSTGTVVDYVDDANKDTGNAGASGRTEILRTLGYVSINVQNAGNTKYTYLNFVNQEGLIVDSTEKFKYGVNSGITGNLDINNSSDDGGIASIQIVRDILANDLKGLDNPIYSAEQDIAYAPSVSINTATLQGRDNFKIGQCTGVMDLSMDLLSAGQVVSISIEPNGNAITLSGTNFILDPSSPPIDTAVGIESIITVKLSRSGKNIYFIHNIPI